MHSFSVSPTIHSCTNNDTTFLWWNHKDNLILVIKARTSQLIWTKRECLFQKRWIKITETARSSYQCVVTERSMLKWKFLKHGLNCISFTQSTICLELLFFFFLKIYVSHSLLPVPIILLFMSFLTSGLLTRLNENITIQRSEDPSPYHLYNLIKSFNSNGTQLIAMALNFFWKDSLNVKISNSIIWQMKRKKATYVMTFNLNYIINELLKF